MNLPTRRILTGLATTVVALASLTDVAVSAADAAGPHHAVAARSTSVAEGTCYRMTKGESAKKVNHANAVNCSRPHTARAFKVVQAPRSVDLSDDTAFLRFAYDTCHPAYAKTVGSTVAGRLLTTYAEVFFAPTERAIQKGDRTVECDVVLFGGKSALAPLPTDAVPALKGRAPYADSVRRCAVPANGNLYYTVCAAEHTLRSTTDYQLHGRYPTRQQFARATARHCGKRQGAINPTKAQWNSGFHYSVCYKETTK